MSQRRRPRRQQNRPSRPQRLHKALDSWFPTVVRYAGLGCMAYATLVDHLQHIALVTAASGMILFKNIWGR